MVYLHLPYFIPEPIEVTDERTTDLDCAYDTEDAFKFFKRKGVDPPGIKIRKNA